VDLRGSRPHPLAAETALARLIRALAGDDAVVPGPFDERLAQYLALVADRAVLVVLDDAADEVQARPLLPTGGACAVLVTSRTPLRALEGAGCLVLGRCRRRTRRSSSRGWPAAPICANTALS
jgi:hypothetical protein